MTEPIDVPTAHRWFAVELNNASWDLLEAPDRGPQDDLRLLCSAYAALRHWMEVGTPLNEQRAHHLVARVLSDLGQADLALRHAEECSRLCDENPSLQTPFDRACAREALARARAAAGQTDEARRLRQEASDESERIEPEAREVFRTLLASGRWYGAD